MARRVDPARHRARRQQIIDAAAELFATHGFDGTSTAEICRAAGMSTGNLFHYFGSKREIFFAVITDDVSDKADQLAAAQSAEDPWRALLEVVGLIVWPATVPQGPPLVMEALVQSRRDSELAEWLRRDEESERDTVEILVARAIAAGRIDPGMDAHDTTSWIMALISAFYIQAVREPEFRPVQQLDNLRLVLRRVLRAG